MRVMKRDVRLQGLSSEHHQALVIARSLTRPTATWTAEEGAALRRRFEAELEPHFCVEEQVLLPGLRRVGEEELVARIEADHAFLRESVVEAAAGDGAVARAFGERLHAHVRFEERELFPACERLLSEEVLDEVARRAPKTR